MQSPARWSEVGSRKDGGKGSDTNGGSREADSVALWPTMPDDTQRHDVDMLQRMMYLEARVAALEARMQALDGAGMEAH